MNIKILLEKIKFFLERLSSKPILGGLQISDSALLYVELSGNRTTAGVRLDPGIIREGKIVDIEKLRLALQQLHASINADPKNIIPVTVVLPTAGVYTQSFNMPNIGSEKIEESAALNLQMISPMAPETSYISWQVLHETQDQFELLGAFTERAFVDSFRTLLEEEHFSPVAMEFPSLALSRLLFIAGNIDTQASLLLQVTNEGLNLSILRNKGLYFDYSRTWRSIQGEDHEITRERFERVVVEEVQKVTNFTISKFKETPKKLYMVAPGYEKEIQTFVQVRFGMSVIPMQIASMNLNPQWYVAVGAALREEDSRKSDRLISLAPADIGSFFYREQALSFIMLWRSLAAAVLGTFIIFFSGSTFVLARELVNSRNDLSIYSANIPTNELTQLMTQVRTFNTLVRNIQTVQAITSPWPKFYRRLIAVTNANQVVIDRVEVITIKDPIMLTAHTSGVEGVTNFRKALALEKDFSAINLYVSEIATREDGSVGFRIKFTYDPSVVVALPPKPTSITPLKAASSTTMMPASTSTGTSTRR